MKSHLQSYAGCIAAGLTRAGAEVDPEILQLPGGSLVATLLWLYSFGVALKKH